MSDVEPTEEPQERGCEEWEVGWGHLASRPIDDSFEVSRPDPLEDEPEPERLGLIRRSLETVKRGIRFMLRPGVAVAVLYVFLFGLFLIEKNFDDDRRDAILGEDAKLESAVEQTGENLEGILCLAQRVDILIDAELTGIDSIADLTPEQFEIIQQSCAEQLSGETPATTTAVPTPPSGEGGAQSSGD